MLVLQRFDSHLIQLGGISSNIECSTCMSHPTVFPCVSGLRSMLWSCTVLSHKLVAIRFPSSSRAVLNLQSPVLSLMPVASCLHSQQQLVSLVCCSDAMSSTSPNSPISGNLVLMSIPYSISAGLLPLVAVDPYASTYLFSSVLQSFFSASAFSKYQFCLSISLFALGQRGVMSLCSTPFPIGTYPFLPRHGWHHYLCE